MIKYLAQTEALLKKCTESLYYLINNVKSSRSSTYGGPHTDKTNRLSSGLALAYNLYNVLPPYYVELFVK